MKVLEVMKTLRADDIMEVTSTVLRDKLGTKNRAVIRSAMKNLQKTGMVTIEKKAFGRARIPNLNRLIGVRLN